MNAGLSNLATLKSIILPDAIAADTQFDAEILAIGRGVAASFDNFCNRRLMRAVGAIDEFDCNRSYASLRNYPIEQITAVDLRFTSQDDWESQPIFDVILNQSNESGIIDFNKILGPNISRLRVTYTGGYFFEQLEPADEGYPTELPDGATPLPPDMLDAWFEQCMSIFVARDTLGQKSIKKVDKETTGDYRFATIGLLQHVIDVLTPYRRYSV